ncbi:MAG: ComEA family DNA-binding protein [Acidimicrobiia bacterium]|nr:ComEA family DNA-binding protein [Acidimicrobiia bacterium]
MPARHVFALAALLLTAVGAGLWYQRSAPQPAPLLVDGSGAAEASVITVHVSGEVADPGLVVVAPGARVAEAVAAAGGTTRDADLARVNLAASLRDGQQVVIPALLADAGSAAIADDGRVRINTATAAQLEELPGVGPVLAGRIAAYRNEHGPFATVEDLLDVPGIGEGKLETLRDSVALP